MDQKRKIATMFEARRNEERAHLQSEAATRGRGRLETRMRAGVFHHGGRILGLLGKSRHGQKNRQTAHGEMVARFIWPALLELPDGVRVSVDVGPVCESVFEGNTGGPQRFPSRWLSDVPRRAEPSFAPEKEYSSYAFCVPFRASRSTA